MRVWLVIALLSGCGWFQCLVKAEETYVRGIYYYSLDTGGIRRMAADGSQDALVFPAIAEQIDVHSEAKQIYWSTSESSRRLSIRRASLSGANQETLVTSSDLYFFGFDPIRKHVYYVGESFRVSGVARLQRNLLRKELDTGIEKVVLTSGVELYPPTPIRVDYVNRLAYFGVITHSINIDRFDQSEADMTEYGFELIRRCCDIQSSFALDVLSNSSYSFSQARPLKLRRTSLSTFEFEESQFDGSDLGVAVHACDCLEPHPGTDWVYFFSGGEDRDWGIYRTNLKTGQLNLIKAIGNEWHPQNSVKFDLDIAPVSERDSTPPVVTVSQPQDVSDSRIVTLGGQVTDDTFALSAWWEINGNYQGALVLGEDGSFLVPDVKLVAGETTLRVVGCDLDGNEGERYHKVIWTPDHRLSLGDSQTLSEGDSVRVPVVLRSDGDIAGMTFEVRYDTHYLEALAFEPGLAIEGAALTANLATQGQAVVTLARPGSPIPSGDQLVGELVLRGRSVPEDVSVEVELTVRDFSDSVGLPIEIEVGLATMGTTLNVNQRAYTGDINTNDRLDVGDAILMQRLLADLDETRAWDHTLNDVNGSTTLDSGDVVQVLRTVLGLLPQPAQRLQLAGLRGRVDARTTPRASLMVDDAMPQSGQEMVVRVQLSALGEPISGASFVLDYPVSVLRLENQADHQVGALVGAGSFSLWNVTPAESDYADQSGSIAFAASASTPWPGSENGGEVAVLRFRVQPGIRDQAISSVVLREVSVPQDGGYHMKDLGGDRLSIIGAPLSYAEWATDRFSVDELRQLEVSGWSASSGSRGVTNGQMYFQGVLDEEQADEALRTAWYVTPDGRQVPVLAIRRALAATEVTMALEYSGNLTDWEGIDSLIYHREPAEEAGFEEWYIGASDEGDVGDWTGLFMRLTFTHSPGT